MDRLKSVWSYISGINLAYILCLGLLGKALVSDISYATFLITIPVLSYEGYKLYLKHKTPSPLVLDAEVRKELDNIKSRLNASTLDKNLKATATPPRYF